MKGRRHTEKAKQLIRLARKNQISPMIGKRHSKEAKIKMSIAHKKGFQKGYKYAAKIREDGEGEYDDKTRELTLFKKAAKGKRDVRVKRDAVAVGAGSGQKRARSGR